MRRDVVNCGAIWRSIVRVLVVLVLAGWLAPAAEAAEQVDKAIDDADRSTATEHITERALRAHIRFLSDDLLEGRDPESRGDQLAQKYVATQLEMMGYEPAAPAGGWYQRVPLVGMRTQLPPTITLKNGDDSLSLQRVKDFIMTAGKQRQETGFQDAELVFVGYGIQAPEYHWDDFKDVDERGKVLLMMNNDPADDLELFKGRTRLYYGRWDYKYQMAAKMGAAGAIIIHTWTPGDEFESARKMAIAERQNVDAAGAELNPDCVARIDAVVSQGIEEGQMPGCVVAIGGSGGLVLLKAYGHRQVEPAKVEMTTDTVFDLASLTKPIATATSVMRLMESGDLKLADPISKHIPEFAQNGKAEVTVLQLLTHQGGLIADNGLSEYADGPQQALKHIFALPLKADPGAKFIYSDVGFIVLGELVKRISGKNVHEFTQEQIFAPLGMRDTGFLPRKELRERAAPTEQRNAHWMQGEVHDPRAYALGGIAGHAGLFSTAEDLALYAQMLLKQGRTGDGQILRGETIDIMTAAYRVSSGTRGLGWDKRTGYSSNRGATFSDKAFGHGGFTGTALWIDPDLDLYVIFLSSRLHPDGKGNVNPLAGRIGTITGECLKRQVKR